MDRFEYNSQWPNKIEMWDKISQLAKMLQRDYKLTVNIPFCHGEMRINRNEHYVKKNNGASFKVCCCSTLHDNLICNHNGWS